MSDDTVPEVAPDVAPEQVQQQTVEETSMSLNVFLFYSLVLVFWVIGMRLGWKSALLLLGADVAPSVKTFLLVIWMIPILGVATSMFTTSLGGLSGWLIGSSVGLIAVPVSLESLNVLIRGTHTNPAA
jgi:hypothetical protein